jgi:hypothetical protein
MMQTCVRSASAAAAASRAQHPSGRRCDGLQRDSQLDLAHVTFSLR